MKKVLIICLLLASILSTQAQSVNEITKLIRQGIEYHDNGQYNEAIKVYKKALEIDPTHSTANYEIAYSYSSLRNYDKAIKHCDIVIKQKKGDPTMAYITKANCLDNQSKSKQAIKVYKKAIKKVGHNYLIHYNLGLTYLKLKDYENCAENAIAGIENNPGHSNSHLTLAYSQLYQGNRTQTILALNYFLLLEHDSKRSQEALRIFNEKIIGDVTSDTDGENKTININISPNTDESFQVAELTLALMDATNGLDLKLEGEGEEEDLTEQEEYVKKIKSFYTMLGELKDEKSKSFFWNFYVPLFSKVAESDHMEAFCYLFTSNNEESAQWIKDNEDKLMDFAKWLENN